MLGLISLLSFLVSLAGQILLIVVVTTIVRRHRPDAWRGLLAWAVASIASSIAIQLGSMVGNTLMGASSVEAVITLHAVITMVGMLFHVGLVLLLARGLVKLAEPAKTEPVPAAGVYR